MRLSKQEVYVHVQLTEVDQTDETMKSIRFLVRFVVLDPLRIGQA